MIKNYEPHDGLLTDDEVKEALNLDYDYTSDRISELSKEAAQFLFQKTNHDWSADTPVNLTAKNAARDYIRQIWYGHDEHTQVRLDDEVIMLQALVDEDGNLYDESNL